MSIINNEDNVEKTDLNEQSFDNLNHLNFSKDEISDSLKKTNHGSRVDLNEIESKILSRREQQILIKRYFQSKFLGDLFKLVFASFLITITFDFFVNSTGITGIFSLGLGAICRLFAIITFPNNINSQSSYFFIYYFLINIPLLFFGYFKIGGKFTILTLFYMLLQILFDQILDVIPYFNSTSFSLLMDYSVMIENSPWVGSIFLFVFSLIAGILFGYSYSILYRIEASTGGTDFITFYFSIKKNKPIGNIARDVNICILVTVIILNTIILKTSDLPVLTRAASLYHFTIDQAKNNHDVYDAQNLYESISNFWNINHLSQPITNDNWKSVISQCCQEGYGNQLKGFILFRTKLLYVFGPSLFASLSGVVIQAFIINRLYPRYRARTYILTTQVESKIVEFITSKGYKSDITSWSVNRSINNVHIERKSIMVSMLILNWKLIEKDLFIIDPELRVVSFQTQDAKGFFSLETASEYEAKVSSVKEFISTNESEMSKIRKAASKKANYEEQKRKNKNSQQKK